MSRAVNEGTPFATFLACASITLGGCASVAAHTRPTTEATEVAPIDREQIRASESAAIRAAALVRCEPDLLARGVGVAVAIDEWLDRNELGEGRYREQPAPALEAFRVGEWNLVLERDRGISGAHVAIHAHDETRTIRYLESGVSASDPGLGQLLTVITAEPGSLLGSFCRVRGMMPIACVYAQVTEGDPPVVMGSPLEPLMDAVAVESRVGADARVVVVGHLLRDGEPEPYVTIDTINPAARTVHRETTQLAAPGVFIGVGVDHAGTVVRAVGYGEGQWLESTTTSAATPTSPQRDFSTRACGVVSRSARLRVPLRFELGDVNYQTNDVVPPFELAYEEDERGPCNVRLELVSRLADLASFDGALGGVLRAPPNGDPRNLSGVITTPFGSLEARCEVVAE